MLAKNTQQRLILATALLTIPFAEFVFLRIFLHSVLQFHIGWGKWMVDFDLIIPGTAAFFLFILAAEEMPRLNLKKQISFLNFILFTSFGLLSVFYGPPIRESSSFFFYCWWAFALATILSAFFVLVSPKAYFSKANRVLLLPTSLMAFSIIFCKHLFDGFWQNQILFIQSQICPIAGFILREPVTCRMMQQTSGEYILKMLIPSF